MASAGILVGFVANQPVVESLLIWRGVGAMTYQVQPGASPAMKFPRGGPYDQRLGYVELPGLIHRLTGRNFEIESQARQSPGLQRFIDAGGYAVYHEKSQAGLTLVDRAGQPLGAVPYPSRAYESFGEIPPLLVNTLRFIEDRDLLDPRQPFRNPAIELRRFALAAAGQVGAVLDPGLKRGGASTLATQIEKYRHSPEGQTAGTREKMRQMATATARAYLDGPDTFAAQQGIVTAYLDSTPLGSRPGYGEIIGFGDGMSAWFGVSFEDANRLLSAQGGGVPLRRRALVYKEALSLLIAQRRPTYYLNAGRADLERLADRYLRALAARGVIEPALRDAALAAPLEFAASAPAPLAVSFVARKAVDAVRTELQSTLGVADAYRLDRMDLTADVSFDAAAQERVAALLERLKDPEAVKALGLVGEHLLGDGDPARVAWSIVVMERGADRDRVRIQADSQDQPFDVNSGAKLILGSTAKLRTLATYLGIVERLHGELAPLAPRELRRMQADGADPIRRWEAGYLAAAPATRRSLRATLDAAMQRRYSAAPDESFLTGGGVHVFHNFEREEDREQPTVEQAFERSVNLAFVRLLRDVIRHYESEFGARDEVLVAADDFLRHELLRRFADRDGTTYLERFYPDYAGLAGDEALERLAAHLRPAPRRLAALYRSVRPEGSLVHMQEFLARHVRDLPTQDDAARLYARYDPLRLALAERSAVAGVHPLELWLVTYLQQHPGATRQQVLAASVDARQQAYAWLFHGENRHAQDESIRGLIEENAFDRLWVDWRRQGYPFGRLVPSLATALGSSGDRPSALATLVGTILNDGVRNPATDLERVRFALGTPYETEMAVRPEEAVRVMSAEVAATLRHALSGVVDGGTASLVRGVYRGPDRAPLAIGGKTGTGDNRLETFGPGHRLIDERPVDRTATFVFFLGDRLYGTITAYVSGPQAGQYHFTSALAVALLKVLAPQLQPLLQAEPAPWGNGPGLIANVPPGASAQALRQPAPPKS